MSGAGFRDQALAMRIEGLGFRDKDFGFRV